MTGLNRLRELHGQGLLVEQYPSVRGLLAGLTGEDLHRAGRLLVRVAAEDVLLAHPDTPSARVVVTGHGTVAAVVPALTAELARHGVLLRPRLGDFGDHLTELADPGNAEVDLVAVLLDPFTVFDTVATPWRPEDVRQAFADRIDLLAGLIAAGSARVVLNTLPLPRLFTAQLLDHRSRAELGAVWREANARLLRLGHDNPRLTVIDLDPLVADGIAVRDPAESVYAKAHLTQELLGAYAHEVAHLVRARTGLGRKVLALDLDETVWGGVLGEVGPEGVEVDGTHRGEAFQAFQRVVRQLGSQGVLVAAVSKNDPEAVRAALADHPGMTLREDDFVRIAAGWGPKHEAITQLAADLNVGVDSVVFVDDSSFERGLVARELPEVAVVAVDEDPAGHVGALLADGWFDAQEVTADDRARPQRYRDELERKDFLHSFDSLAGYLAELGVRVGLDAATPADVARLSQVTLRTNQFNLTTRRLQPADVEALLADPTATVLAVRSADRFGDNGLVGAVFLRRDDAVLHVDNFLLSCRVFSRGVEATALSAVLRHALATGATEVRAGYVPSRKNGKVADFYPRHGFTEVGPGEFRHDLTDIAPPPDHVELTGSWALETTA